MVESTDLEPADMESAGRESPLCYENNSLLSNSSVDQRLQPNTVSHLRMIYINGRKTWKTGGSRDFAQFSFKVFLSELWRNCLWATKLASVRFLLFSPYSIKDYEKKGIYVQLTNEAMKVQWVNGWLSPSSNQVLVTGRIQGHGASHSCLAWRVSTLNCEKAWLGPILWS